MEEWNTKEGEEIIPGDETQTAEMAQTQWEEARGGRLVWKCTIALEFTKALSRKKVQILKKKKRKEGTISLRLFNSGLIFILRWVLNYYFLSSFLLDGAHLYFGFSSREMQTNVI